MKTIVTATIVTISLLLTGINTLNKHTILKNSKTEVPSIDGIKVYKPSLPATAPTCPSAEYQLAINRQAEGQLGMTHTEHCPKCSMGALYSKDGRKTCTYCEQTFVLND
jgi:hypothetical protein